VVEEGFLQLLSLTYLDITSTDAANSRNVVILCLRNGLHRFGEGLEYNLRTHLLLNYKARIHPITGIQGLELDARGGPLLRLPSLHVGMPPRPHDLDLEGFEVELRDLEFGLHDHGDVALRRVGDLNLGGAPPRYDSLPWVDLHISGLL
jgi:hypothetical protein